MRHRRYQIVLDYHLHLHQHQHRHHSIILNDLSQVDVVCDDQRRVPVGGASALNHHLHRHQVLVMISQQQLLLQLRRLRQKRNPLG